jgi:hypothetical protein
LKKWQGGFSVDSGIKCCPSEKLWFYGGNGERNAFERLYRKKNPSDLVMG